MRIAICDDNPIDREIIIHLLQKYFTEKSIDYEAVQYENGIKLISEIEAGTWYDIVFLDIYMNDVLGIDVACKLRGLKYYGHIVFLTASPEFAVDSYDVGAAGYLLKPHSFEKLDMVLDRLTHGMNASAYQIKRHSKIIQIPKNEILFVESNNSKCILHAQDGEDYVIYKRLDVIEEELDDERFLRCQQSYLVNMDHISQLDKQFILMTGEAVLIRQRDLKAMRQTYLDYMAGKTQRMSGS